MNSDPQVVDFLGYEIDLVEDHDGEAYVPLKRLCEILGIDHKWEMKKVKTEGIIQRKGFACAGKRWKTPQDVLSAFEKIVLLDI
jgi:hypothetical protein